MDPCLSSKALRDHTQHGQAYIPGHSSSGRMARPARLDVLPDDILLLLVNFVDIRGILALRLTSKRFLALTKLLWVWKAALQRLVYEEKLPLPGRKVDTTSLSQKELEQRVVHAAEFHQNWLSQNLSIRESTIFSTKRSTADRETDVVHILPGRNAEYILTISDWREVELWEVPLRGSRVLRLATLRSMNRTLCGVACNDDPDSEGIFCMIYGGRETFRGSFTPLSRAVPMHLEVNVLVMHGDWILTEDLCLHHWRKNEALRLIASADGLLENEALCAKYINGYFFIVRQFSIILIKAPDVDDSGSFVNTRSPLYVLTTWDHPVQEAAIFLQDSAYHNRQTGWPSAPISVLLRGVRDLRKADFAPSDLVAASQSGSAPAGSSSRDEPDSAGLLLTQISSIPVTPSQGDIRIGPSGKGIWLETRNVTQNHSTYPARCIVGFNLREQTQQEAPSTPSNPLSVHHQLPGNVLELCQKEVYVQRIGSMAPWTPGNMNALPGMAFDDTVGRIAIARREGKVQILDFA
ncbi:hypothetical protein OE88DRAFT_1272741 [Heliocybe sulcata]|uniref:F-box domain-containing protein n=1 Tax=Heliocybe sulcata TaxID=5364 RepID=A0A5C3N7M0_9AGAM|nr:hypothetical protein OE88DRAFT_1272741 [Heliocybe sulcata]